MAWSIGMGLVLAHGTASAQCWTGTANPCPTSGSTCYVESSADDGSCGTFRHCVETFAFSGGNNIDIGTCGGGSVSLATGITVDQSLDIYKGSGGSGTITGTSTSVVTITADNVTVTGLNFTGFTGGPPAVYVLGADGVEVSHSTFTDNSLGIGVEDSTNANVHDNSVSGSTTDYSGAISVVGSTGVTVADNELSDNAGFGVAVRQDSPTTDLTVTGNTISGSGQMGIAAIGDGLTIDGNDVSDSAGGPDIAVLPGPSAGSVADNTVSGGASGIVIGGGADNFMITGNTVTDTDGDGIDLQASSAVVQGNVVHGNGGMGIASAPDFGEDRSSDGEDDDHVGTPTIGGSDTGEANTVYGNDAGGILIVDSATTNSATLEDDNSFPSTQANFVAAQVWYGLVEVFDSGNTTALSGATATVFGDGLVPLATGTTDAAGILGPPGYTLSDVTTWYPIPEFYVVQGSPNTRYTFAPHVEAASLTGYSSSPVGYSWDGATTGDPTNAFGEVNCKMTDGYCRYQIAEIPMTNP